MHFDTRVLQQIKVTSFIDASLLYGSDNNTASSLRTFTDGKLARQVTYNGKSFLPNVINATKTCNVVHNDTACYTSGSYEYQIIQYILHKLCII